MAETYIRVGEAAKLLGVSTSTLSSWQREGVLKPAQVFPSGHRRYTLSQVQEFIKNHENVSQLDDVDDNEIYMTSSDTADYMQVSISLLNTWTANGELIPRRKLPTNNRRMYAKSDVDAFLKRISNV